MKYVSCWSPGFGKAERLYYLDSNVDAFMAVSTLKCLLSLFSLPVALSFPVITSTGACCREECRSFLRDCFTVQMFCSTSGLIEATHSQFADSAVHSSPSLLKYPLFLFDLAAASSLRVNEFWVFLDAEGLPLASDTLFKKSELTPWGIRLICVYCLPKCEAIPELSVISEQQMKPVKVWEQIIQREGCKEDIQNTVKDWRTYYSNWSAVECCLMVRMASISDVLSCWLRCYAHFFMRHWSLQVLTASTLFNPGHKFSLIIPQCWHFSPVDKDCEADHSTMLSECNIFKCKIKKKAFSERSASSIEAQHKSELSILISHWMNLKCSMHSMWKDWCQFLKLKAAFIKIADIMCLPLLTENIWTSSLTLLKSLPTYWSAIHRLNGLNCDFLSAFSLSFFTVSIRFKWERRWSLINFDELWICTWPVEPAHPWLSRISLINTFRFKWWSENLLDWAIVSWEDTYWQWSISQDLSTLPQVACSSSMVSMSDEKQVTRAEETAMKRWLHSSLQCTVEYFRSVAGQDAAWCDKRHDGFEVWWGRSPSCTFWAHWTVKLQEMFHYLNHIKTFWSRLFQHNKCDMQKVDHITVKALELKALSTSTSDTMTLFHQLKKGEIFSAFNLNCHMEIWMRLHAWESLVLTL